jgi:hypothetical protein
MRNSFSLFLIYFVWFCWPETTENMRLVPKGGRGAAPNDDDAPAHGQGLMRVALASTAPLHARKSLYVNSMVLLVMDSGEEQSMSADKFL